MKSLPSSLVAAKNQTAQATPWLILLDITLSDPDNPENSTDLHLINNTENLTFGGQEYTAFPFEIEPTSSDSKGKIPTVTLRISNVLGVLQADLDAYKGGNGSTVTITVVSADHLDEDYTELRQDLQVLACEADAQWVSFTLGAANPLNQRVPLNRYMARHCSWRFGSPECGYTGTEYTDCDRTLIACRHRGQAANFGGYVGLQHGGITVA